MIANTKLWRDLFAKLSPQLNGILPRDIRVRSDDHAVSILVRETIVQSTEFELFEDADVARTLEIFLSGLQDLIIIETLHAWPALHAATRPHGGERDLPTPDVRAVDDTISISFRVGDVVTLPVADIPLKR